MRIRKRQLEGLMGCLFTVFPCENHQEISRTGSRDDRSVRQQIRRMRTAARITRKDALLRRDIHQRHAAMGRRDQYLRPVIHNFCFVDMVESFERFRRNIRITFRIPFP